MNKRALIVLNGEIEPALPLVKREDYQLIIAVDGAINTLLDQGWTPDVLLGDFDSVSDLAMQVALEAEVKVIHTPDQDFTDFEKALRLPEIQDVTDIDLIGHSGRRLDHTLGSLYAAISLADRFKFRLIDPAGTGYLVPGGEMLPLKDQVDNLCSVLGLVPSIVSLDGFQWPLQDAEIGGLNKQSISNIIVSENARIRVTKGAVLVYLPRAES
ncbi:thiamine pyrophosphokinase [bacterium BMS3Bbin04]|nr:thiamine pyrophosphokinase [bacterium BMS3Bbin04]